MNDIQKKIDDAFRMISAIHVNGDAVDVMAAVRINLKEAYKMSGDKAALWAAHKLAEKENPEDTDG